MNTISSFYHRYFRLGLLFIWCILFTCGCMADSSLDSEKVVIVRGNGVSQETRMTLPEMLELSDARFEHVYSTINNWPNNKTWAARGVKVAAVLQAAGIKDEAQCITFKGEDGYECSFTRGQLLDTKRYYFPGLTKEDPAGAELVEPIIAFEYAEDTDQLSRAKAGKLCLIIPQANVKEQTQHTFVKGVKEIIVIADSPGKWAEATAFPAAGKIARGEKVKLQHKEMGKVKMYYTLDGSIPTEQSLLYNPSTYQMELNKPIVIDHDTTIKVLVKGFGKYDSDIAEFHYEI